MHLDPFYFSCTYNARTGSQRILIKDYIITHTLINEIAALIVFVIANPKQQFKVVSFSDILTTLVYSK